MYSRNLAKRILVSLDSKKQTAKPSQNFGLKEEEFERMVLRMQQGDEALFEKVFLSQFEDCIKYLMFRYSINRSSAYDVTMDALLKFRKRLIAGKISYGNMRFLFTRMASQFLSDSTKKETVLLENYNEEPVVEEIGDDVLDALDKAWRQLCGDCRSLLDSFYYQKITLKSLADETGKSEAAMRKQKQRCLEKIRLYFLKYF